MQLSDIFREVVSITEQDYSGCEDRKLVAFQPFLDMVIKLERKNTLSSLLFSKIVNTYLHQFLDPHMYFTYRSNSEETMDVGFGVRRYGDRLYVTQTIEETPLSKGDSIVSIDGKSIEVISREHHLPVAHTERQNWNYLIQRAKSIELEDNRVLEIVEYPSKQNEDSFVVKVLEDDLVYMNLPHFQNPSLIINILQKYKDVLERSTRLIIDVRKNNGGLSAAFNPLLDFIFPSSEKPKSIAKAKEFNCTERNAALFNELYRNVKESYPNHESLPLLTYANEMFQTNKGFTEFDFSPYTKEVTTDFNSNDQIEKIVVLSDCYCASAGDDFVEMCKQSSKVTVMGRATLGVNDYSDLVTMKWNKDFSLHYPTSRLVRKTEVHPIHGTGIVPDIYIPWTPEHISRDVDLEMAIELILKK
ncbi:S41 family peptidase [Mangrovibacillus cuniculi]|uniref:Tail specific protease domain-containing protein n=1 Tax=Mangrovibacillus cuniculi TaxID=2593652 RepID=A0A7S8C917_9BACI|nr:S41 family peptidase [Mangrovibacillus cuniculi]QPC45558.1 hypothetical protein G8O30_00485 [Mangrovibacillus cuniculi]